MLAGSLFAAGAEEGTATERGPIEMTYLRFGGPDDITQEEALIARWEEANPGDTVEPLIAPFPQFKEKLDTMIAGGQSPDIIFGWPTPFANLWANERIISLNELEQGDVDFNIDDYPQHKQFIFDGELTGIPYNATAHILVYNKTMFEEATWRRRSRCTTAALGPGPTPSKWPRRSRSTRMATACPTSTAR